MQLLESLSSELSNIAETLTEARISLGLSQHDLGFLVGTDACSINRREKGGYSKSTLTTIFKTIAALEEYASYE